MQNLYLQNKIINAEIDGRVRKVDASKLSTNDLRHALAIGIAELVHQGKLKSNDICTD